MSKNHLNTTEIVRVLGMTKNTSDILKYSDNASLAKLVFRVGLSSYINMVSFILLW